MLNDNEIKKALECCKYHRECCFCNYVEECGNKRNLTISTLDLINRLEAENEDIKFLYENLKEEHLEIIKAIKHTKAEAYKEFAERVKEKAVPHYFDNCNYAVEIEQIDNLLKELVGEDNGESSNSL
jgi:hypothetical protein